MSNDLLKPMIVAQLHLTLENFGNEKFFFFFVFLFQFVFNFILVLTILLTIAYSAIICHSKALLLK